MPPINLLSRVFRALALDITPLRHVRDFRLLYFGQVVSSLGTMMTYVVIPYQVYQLTRSSLLVGLLGVAEFVPLLALALVGGALADAVDRRRLILTTEFLLTICTGVLWLNAWAWKPRLWLIFVLAGTRAALSALQRPAREALTPRIVPPEMMPAVAALRSAAFNVSGIGGRALGGILAVKFGPAFAYAIDAVSFAASLTSLFLLSAIPAAVNARRVSLSAIMEGLRYARSRRELLATYLIDINAMFFGMPMALFPALAEGFGPGWVGWFYAMPSVGAFCASFTSGWTKRINRQGLAITIAASLWGAAIVAFGLAGNLWLALFFLALAGAADEISAIFRVTMWNESIPDHLRGRLASIEMLSYLSGPKLGDAEAGLVASLSSPRVSVVSGGALCVAGSLVLAFCLPAFLRYDGREGRARKKEADAEQRAAA